MRLLWLACLGCGRIEFDPRTDAAGPIDAPGECWAAWTDGLPPLSAPILVAELDATGIEHDMSLTTDGTQLYFASDRPSTLGQNDIYVATRSGPSGPFTNVEHVSSLSSDQGEGSFFTRDGLTGILASERPGTSAEGSADLWFAQRATHQQPFTLTHMGAQLNSPAADYDAWLSLDERRLYYSTGTQISLSARATPTDPWNPPVPVAGVNAAGEYDPNLSPDERVIVFTSFRLSPGRDVFVATRPDRDSDFSMPVSVGAITSNASEYDPHVAPDGCSIYFASDRATQPGDLQIYVVRVEP